MLKTSGTITNKTLIILIDLSAIESFIFSEAQKWIKVKEVDQNEFIFVEIALGAK
jgi:hypothetical protein